MNYFFGLILVVLVLTSAELEAGSARLIQTGAGLVKMCGGSDKVKALSMMCHSYLNGYLDTVAYLGRDGQYCLAAGDKDRLPTMTLYWLKAHPDYLARPAPESLAKLLPALFPCK